MYTKEWDSCYSRNGGWEILDPDGKYVCYIEGEANADYLLSHLNRG